MKNILLCFLLCFAYHVNYGQESYTINGENLMLKTEVEGQLDLLWNTFNSNYRYFIKTEDGIITELTNTKDTNNIYLEEYKATLSELTNGIPTDELKFALYNLKVYIDTYNTSVDSSYTSIIEKPKLGFRLGFSGGLTNNPFVSNPNNTIVPLIGAELEIYEASAMPKHSGFLQARHAFDSDDFSYSTYELALGYRYRIINKKSFSIYGQVKLATLNFFNATLQDELDSAFGKEISDTTFDAPFIFGIGSDIKVGGNSYITIIYGELFAAFLNNQGNFSTDIALGYKFNL